MKEEFVTYEQAVALKDLGFDEPCLAGYNFKDRRNGQFTFPSAKEPNTTSKARVYHNDKKIVGAPLYQQAFRWFRKKHGLYGEIKTDSKYKPYIHTYSTDGEVNTFKTIDSSYDEGHSICLNRLIEILLLLKK